MRTLCAILLLGVVAYVQASHHCDPYAVNVAEANTQRTGHDANNEHLALENFLKKKKSAFYTTHATPSNLPTSNAAYCTALTHGSECAGVEYYRILKDGFDTFDPATLLKGIQFDTGFIGYSKDHTAIEYKMTIGGHNEDDYIFKWVEGTEITAHKLEVINDPDRKTPVTIPNDVLKVLKSEFALYFYKPGKYSLYVTCDGKVAWVTYNMAVGFPPPVDDDLDSAIRKLVAHAKEKDNVDLIVSPIDLRFPSMLSVYIESQAK